jgi:hypothetical protein
MVDFGPATVGYLTKDETRAQLRNCWSSRRTAIEPKSGRGANPDATNSGNCPLCEKRVEDANCDNNGIDFSLLQGKIAFRITGVAGVSCAGLLPALCKLFFEELLRCSAYDTTKLLGCQIDILGYTGVLGASPRS